MSSSQAQVRTIEVQAYRYSFPAVCYVVGEPWPGRKKIVELRIDYWLHWAEIDSEFLIAYPSHIGAGALNWFGRLTDRIGFAHQNDGLTDEGKAKPLCTMPENWKTKYCERANSMPEM
jgi:hypothetical protein